MSPLLDLLLQSTVKLHFYHETSVNRSDLRLRRSFTFKGLRQNNCDRAQAL